MAKVSDKELLEAQRLAQAGILFAPASFKNASLAELRNKTNGCGAAGSWFRPPKRIWGTLIVYACIIHDWMYGEGRTDDDKREADRTMHHNIDRLIERDSHKWYKPTILQHFRSLIYYGGVNFFAGSAFWKGKN